MSKGFDYSKWDKIDVSDSDEEVHPNIDKASWRRMKQRHRSEEQDDQVEELNRLKEVDTPEAKKKIAELEKKREWQAETMTRDKWNHSAINEDARKTETKTPTGPMSEEEQAQNYEQYAKKHKSMLKEYSELDDDEESRDFMKDHPDIMSEHATGWMLLECLDQEMKGNHDVMEKVARQYLLLQYVIELAQSMNREPREAIIPFFKKVSIKEKQHTEGFEDDLAAFIKRVKARAIQKKEEQEAAAKEEIVEEVVEEVPLGPGGLNPVEVFESLPECMQEAFEKKDMPLLHKAIASMPVEEAKYHIDRCTASGLWDPAGGKSEEE